MSKITMTSQPSLSQDALYLYPIW